MPEPRGHSCPQVRKKEILCQSLAVAVWWLASLTLLLPLACALQLSTRFRHHFLSFGCADYVEGTEKPQCTCLRKRAFEKLQGYLNNVRRVFTRPLEFLEVGVGAGRNLEFYPADSNLTALDPNPNFALEYFPAVARRHPRLHCAAVLGVAEDMRQVGDATVDVVVTTYVLCSVRDPEKALAEIRRVLKPGGVYLFLEHEVFGRGEGTRLVQKAASPLYRVFRSCSVARNHQKAIRKAGFASVDLETSFPNKVNLLTRRQILGVAVN